MKDKMTLLQDLGQSILLAPVGLTSHAAAWLSGLGGAMGGVATGVSSRIGK